MTLWHFCLLATFLLLTAGLVVITPVHAQNVKMIPVGSHVGEFCCFDRAGGLSVR
jgi:hypothetical protein